MESDNVSILLGNGDGTFTAAANYRVGNGPHSVTGGDFDGDGDIDLATANSNSNDVSILLGNGDGTFDIEDASFIAGANPSAVVACDLCNDSRIDLIVANIISGDVSILINNTTASSTEDGIYSPPAFALGQNYPNPFNPSTTIFFSIPERARVTLDVFDVSGRRITRLVDSVHGPGAYRFEWNGRNESGKAVSSGVYFYRLTTGMRSMTRKMVLLR